MIKLDVNEAMEVLHENTDIGLLFYVKNLVGFIAIKSCPSFC